MGWGGGKGGAPFMGGGKGGVGLFGTNVWQPQMQGGGGKGGGKGKKRGGSRMASTPADQKVWIGNLSKTTTWKTLEAHLRIAGTTKWVEVDRGSGGASFATAAEALNAIAMLNMSVLDGNQIIVDVWKTSKA